MSNIQSSFSLKIIRDLTRAIQQDPSINSFEIVPTPASENKNSSPVLRGESALGFESWAVKHVLPFAHKHILDTNLQKDSGTMPSFVLAVNLLHPEMPAAWSRRRELITQRKMSVSDELRITRMALSRIPKCNEALAHRRWLIFNRLLPGDRGSILDEELDLADVIADRYPSNYHAWSHRQWCLQQLAPPSRRDAVVLSATPVAEFTKRDMCYVFTASALPIYLNELMANFKFVSRHVSDHSGLHFRTFLLKQIFVIFKSSVCDSKKNNTVDRDHANEALLFYSNLKANVTEFLTGFDDLDIQDYLSNLQYKLTLFDTTLSLILAELKTNASLCETFVGHEALWCYRKFLVFTLHSALCEISSYPGQSELGNVLRQQFLSSEQSMIRLHDLQKCDEHDPRVITNYCNWLKRAVKWDIHIS